MEKTAKPASTKAFPRLAEKRGSKYSVNNQ
jgi:hypothetical protein